MIIVVNGVHPQPRRIEEAAKILRSGGIVAYPTDTVYALGCDLRSKAAAKTLYELKKKSALKKEGASHLSIIVPDLSSISRWAIVEGGAYRLLRKATPGAYTFVLRASREVPRMMVKKQRTIGVRIPDAPVAMALAEAIDGPLLTTTAKAQDGELLSDPREIERLYKNMVGAVLDAGPLIPEPSTVVDLSGEYPSVIREGKGDLADLGIL